jgi:hypothetical protein
MALTAEEVIYNLAIELLGGFNIEDTPVSKADKPYRLASNYYALARDTILGRHNWNEAVTQVIVSQEAPTSNPLFEYNRKYTIPTGSMKIISVGSRNVYGEPSQGDIWPWDVVGEFIMSNADQIPQLWATETDYVVGEYISRKMEIWVALTDYVVGQYVSNSSTTYVCATAHTAGATFATTNWTETTDEITDNVSYVCATAHESGTFADDLESAYWTTSGVNYRIIYVTYIKQLTDTTKWSARLKDAIVHQLAIYIVTALHNDPKQRLILVNQLEQLILPQARSVDSQQGKPKRLFASRYMRSRFQGNAGRRFY